MRVRPTSPLLLVPALMTAIAAVVMLLPAGCNQYDDRSENSNGDETRPAGSDGWLTGTTHDKFDTLADQLGGFDQTMIEVGYRYVELYWAGEDRNWQYAAYQAEEMREAIERGLERRPARRPASQPFLDVTLTELEAAIETEDYEVYTARFRQMTTYCNMCHAMEGVGFIHVRKPEVRHRPWGAP